MQQQQQGGARLRHLNPLRLFHGNFSYQELPSDSRNTSPFTLQPLKRVRWPSPKRAGEAMRSVRWSPLRILLWALTSLLVLLMLIATRHHKFREPPAPANPDPALEKPPGYPWEEYPQLKGFYNGIRTLTPAKEWVPQNRYNKSVPEGVVDGNEARGLPKQPAFDPIKLNPYPDYNSYEYTQKHGKVETCYMDEEDKVEVPDVYVYPGLPRNMTAPFFGTHKELGIRDDVCYDRFGRLGPYGYGYNASAGGLGPGLDSENVGTDQLFEKMGTVDYSNVNWGKAMKKCHSKNKARFENKDAHRKVARHAYILRIWTGYNFNYNQLYSLRAMIAELSLKSGGEYDVWFLLHVKDETLPIWADKGVYQKVIEQNMPKEFWNMTVLWSESQLLNYYPPPFAEPFENPSQQSVHGVYRSAHFALQWFGQQYPDYDFYWNWEMDLRYNGHYYELNTALGDWARKQPRKGMWERAERFWMPELHGSYQNFTDMVERETRENGKTPVWGPPAFQNDGLSTPPSDTTPPMSYDKDEFKWGVGEEADLITFNPLFDPSKTNWVFRLDATGYSLKMPPPPRRCAIITVSRLSKRLMDIMHEETWKYRHTMFPEMWPASCALQHGLKGVYAPHPVYFDRDWDLEYMDRMFNRPRLDVDSPFGWGEHNFIGSSFYYNSQFSGALWRRWLGLRENKEGGTREEETGTGRLCLLPSISHPVKSEIGENN
ncbi:hypothetical protein E4T52_04344 [Aureobasidium sp. EXF-3400]|nr:hypothetical protein E4T51_06032 [Aureobasidium sp. EXF-12344]KAI4780764.1 hypothetical protein E4T52_04344 [Aureobasidium sp. EXF-3400]